MYNLETTMQKSIDERVLELLTELAEAFEGDEGTRTKITFGPRTKTKILDILKTIKGEQ